MRAAFIACMIVGRVCMALASPGEVDATFKPGKGALREGSSLADIWACGIQPDGKIVLAGQFSAFDGHPASNVVRLNRDGSVDTAFFGSLDGPGTALAIAPDGKILIGGLTSTVAAGSSIARLTVDGSLDSTFKVHLRGPSGGALVTDILALTNGRIAIVGRFTNVNDIARARIAVLNADGTVDTTFQPGSGIEEEGYSYAVAVQADGKLLVGGSFTRVAGQPRSGLARFNPDGTLDPAFHPVFLNPGSSWPSGAVYTVREAGDGRIVAGGTFSTVDGQRRIALARLKADGSLDTGYDLLFEPLQQSDPIITSIDFQSDGKLLVAGYIQLRDSGVIYPWGVRLTADGRLDRGFFSDAQTHMQSMRVLVQPDGAIILTGTFSSYSESAARGIVRLQGGDATSVRIIGQPISQRQPAGSRVALSAVVVGEDPITFQWYRNGAPIVGAKQSTFVIENLALADAGQYAVSAENRFGQLTSNSATLTVIEPPVVPGSVNAAFDPQISGPVSQLALASDGKIVIAGTFTTVGGTPQTGLARLHANGTLDPSFAPTIETSGIVALTSLPDQRVLLATSRYPILGIPPNTVLALSPSGTVEATLEFASILKAGGFDTNARYAVTKMFVLPDGTAILSQSANVGITNQVVYYVLRLAGNTLTATATNLTVDPTIPRQSTGKIITTETEYLSGPPANYVLLRRDDGGAVDELFRTILGKAVSSPPIAVQPDDYFLTVPYLTETGPGVSQPDTALRRYRPDGTVDAAFSPIVLMPPFAYPTGPVSALVVEPDGTALLAGGFSSLNKASRANLVRINLGEFQPPAIPRAIAPPESRDVLVGQTSVLRANLDATGPLQLQWHFGNQLWPGRTNLTLALTNISDGHEGDYSVELKNAAGSVRSAPARVTVVPAPGGSVDPAFDPGSGADDGQVNALLLEPDGRILVGGTFTKFNGAPRAGLVRLNRDGSLDSTFDPGRSSPNASAITSLTVDVLARHRDGRIYLAGGLQQTGGAFRTNVYRLNQGGALDPSFQASPASPPAIMSLLALPDSRVLVGGTFNYTNSRGITFGDSFRNLVRLSAEGELDRTYQPSVSASQSGMRFFLPGNVRAMELLDDQRLLVAGAFEPRGIGASFARLNPDGSRDTNFQPRVYVGVDQLGRGGVPTLTAMALDKRGESAIAGTFYVAGGGPGIARFTADGHLIGLNAAIQGSGVNALAFQPDGKLLVGGAFDGIGGVARSNLARLHRDGSVDLSFGRAGGGPDGAVATLVIEPSGAILIGGKFTSVDEVARRGVARLYPSGKVYRQLLRPGIETGAFSASVHTLAGKRYRLERSDSLISPVWNGVQTFEGDGHLKKVSDPNTGPGPRFYRLRIE